MRSGNPDDDYWVLLTHQADKLAARRRVITFDNRRVGASGGTTPATIEATAHDAVLFIRALGSEWCLGSGRALGFDQVDLPVARLPRGELVPLYPDA
ncbi:alpha/beta fold hydrolase [Streptomyces sp. NPDC060048]|uniref:alpha/beta fold hydrolase n=1 Tax=unclassified Streptomyces TaxID=2593676 RepID=UPI003689BA16